MRDDTEDLATAPPAGVGSFLHVDVAEHGTAAVVLLSGDLDLDSAPRLRAALDRVVAHGDHEVAVDVRERPVPGHDDGGLQLAHDEHLEVAHEQLLGQLVMVGDGDQRVIQRGTLF